jgi:hypothetical protein
VSHVSDRETTSRRTSPNPKQTARPVILIQLYFSSDALNGKEVPANLAGFPQYDPDGSAFELLFDVFEIAVITTVALADTRGTDGGVPSPIDSKSFEVPLREVLIQHKARNPVTGVGFGPNFA